MDQVIYESKRKETPGYAEPIRVLLVERPGGKGRFVRVEKWDPEQEQYVPDRQGSGIPWPWGRRSGAGRAGLRPAQAEPAA